MKRGLAVVIAFAATCILSSPAAADDHRPCVSLREFRGSQHLLDEGITLRQITERWEVTGLGMNIAAPGNDRPIWSYPACGYDHTTREAEVFVLTRDRHTVAAVGRGRIGGTVPHGHVRQSRSSR